MNKRIAVTVMGMVALGASYAGAAQYATTQLTNETGLAYNNTYVVSIDTFADNQVGAQRVAAQVIYGSMTPTTDTFNSGTQSTETFTIVSTQPLVSAFATDKITLPTTSAIVPQASTAQITVTSLSNLGSGATAQITIFSTGSLSGVTIILNGATTVGLLAGSNFSTGSSTATACANLATAINSYTSVTNIACTCPTATNTSILYATATVNGLPGDSYSITTTSLPIVSSMSFTGGKANAVININGRLLTNQNEWTAQTTTSMTALSIAAAINTVMSGIVVSTDPTGTGSIIYSTAVVPGIAGNAITIISTPSASLTPSATFYSGGHNDVLSGAFINFNGNIGLNGQQWSDAAFSSVTATYVQTSTIAAASIAAWLNNFTTSIQATALTALGAPATGYITVNNNSGISSAVITVNGNISVNLAQGLQWFTGATSSNTATSIATAINLYTPQTGIVASVTGTQTTIYSSATVNGTAGNSYSFVSNDLSITALPFANGSNPTYGSIVYATATVANSASNAFTLSSSTGSFLTVANPTFTGGQDSATVTINGIVLTAGTQGPSGFAVGATVGATAINLSSAIMNNPTLNKVLVSTTALGQAVVNSTSTAVGTSTNYTVATSTAAILTNNGAFFGGTNSAWALNSAVINIPGHGYTTALQVYFSTKSAIALTPLGGGATYYVIVVDSNDVALATSNANAVAGSSVTLTSSSTLTTAANYSLTPLAIAGTVSWKFQVSNDQINWNDFPTPSTYTVGSYVFPSTSTVVDFGNVDWNYMRMNVTAPTSGGVLLKTKLNGQL